MVSPKLSVANCACNLKEGADVKRITSWWHLATQTKMILNCDKTFARHR